MTSSSEYRSNDGQQLDQVIAEYLRAEAAGQAGDLQQWLDRYPTCAASLAEFFDNRQLIGQLVVPLRSEQATLPINHNSNRSDGSARPSAQFDTVEFDPEPPRLSNSRYRPLRFHARGGMGEIWLAEDELIGRQVAVKKLRTGRDSQKTRFLVEAQITGQLEHPSIVPLHDLGMDEAGHPFYVMKFIHGTRLSQVVSDFHAQKSPVDWPSDLKFRLLLESFANICNVVAYAHSKGVVHRDIKPDNVMFGAYGEVVVLDWGLAKVIGQMDEEGNRGVRLSGEGSTHTQDGSIVGSPFYMSPEGATGRPEAVDQSSDVYLLGSTLYHILTGQPPRKGTSSWELIDLALHSRPADPRKIDPRIPQAIEAVCLKAMAFDKQDRYPTPLALAEDVQKFLAGQPTSAYREPLIVRIARRLRRYRRGIFRGAIAASIVALGALALHNYQQAQSLAATEVDRKQLEEFNRLADEAQFFAANTDTVSERAPYYDPRRATAAGKAALAIAAPWGEHAENLSIPEAREEFLHAECSLLLLMSETELRGSHDRDGARRALTLLDKAGPLESLSRGYHTLRGKCLALIGEASEANQQEQQANDATKPMTAQDHFLRGESLRSMDVGTAAAVMGGDAPLPPREHLNLALSEYNQALKLDPRHYWARFQLGRCLLALGRTPEAIETLSACIALRPNSPWAYTSRGLALAISDHPEDAMFDLDRAVELDPNFYPARLNRGFVFWQRHKGGAAKAEFDAVLSAPADQMLAEAAFYRGQLLLQEQNDRQALADFTSVVDALPEFRPAYRLRSETQFRLGNSQAGLSDLTKFLALAESSPGPHNKSAELLALGKALRQMAQLLEGDMRVQLLHQSAEQLEAVIASGDAAPELFENLGAVRELLEKPDSAIEAYSQGIALSDDDVKLRNLRGWAYVRSKQFDLAQADFSEAVRLSPGNPESHAGLGYVLTLLEDTNGARREASTALLIGSNNYLVLHNVACIYGRLSEVDAECKVEHENLALALLTRATSVSQQHTPQPDADEVALIRKETAFPAALCARPEFQRLLGSDSTEQGKEFAPNR